MNVISPRGWSAQVNYDQWTDPYTPDDKIILHYGGGDQSGAYDGPHREAEILRAWERYHLSRGWRGLAYGWAVGMSGAVYRARGWNSYGAHRGDLEPDGIPENAEGVPVVFILGGDQQPTVEALASFEQLRSEVIEARIGRVPLYGHREIAELGTGTETQCPGEHVMDYIEAERVEESNMSFLPLRKGDGKGNREFKRSDVAAVQALLNRAYRAKLTEDGVYGEKTAAAIAEHVGGNGNSFYGSLFDDLIYAVARKAADDKAGAKHTHNVEVKLK